MSRNSDKGLRYVCKKGSIQQREGLVMVSHDQETTGIEERRTKSRSSMARLQTHHRFTQYASYIVVRAHIENSSQVTLLRKRAHHDVVHGLRNRRNGIGMYIHGSLHSRQSAQLR